MDTDDKRDQIRQQREARRRATPADYMHWVDAARRMLADHFPAERGQAHNALVITTANSLMLAHRLGEIDHVLDEIRQALENPDRS